MKVISFHIPEELLRRLDEVARAGNTTRANVLRLAVRLLLEQDPNVILSELSDGRKERKLKAVKDVEVFTTNVVYVCAECGAEVGRIARRNNKMYVLLFDRALIPLGKFKEVLIRCPKCGRTIGQWR